MTQALKRNADSQEIQKFDALASRWWDPVGEFKPLHQLNPIRLGFIQQTVSLAGLKVLDVGCGGGILSESMARAGADVTAIDLAGEALAVARLHAKDSDLSINYREIAIEELALELPDAFDVVTCLELLEHVPDPGRLISDCARVLKPGGNAFFSTINRTPKAYALAVVGAEYVLGLLPKGTHDYAKFLKPSEMGGFLRATGLSLEKIKGLRYNPLTEVHSLCDDIDVNYIMHASFPQ